jgi:predicted dehydrogenase
MSGRKIRVGVVGVGALGQHHARVYASLPDVQLAGVCDRNVDRGGEVARRHGCQAYPTLLELLPEVDALSVAVPTASHYEVTRQCLESGKDVLVEKPITETLDQADQLVTLAGQRNAVLQVGHIERFNPAGEMLLREVREPRFIEVHRLGSFPARSLDIDVVLDLMVHDLDMVLALDGSEPVQVDAVGVAVLTPRIDIANARLRFASGLIANLTASRVSTERVRKFRVFASGGYISVDFVGREARVYRLAAGTDRRPEIREEVFKGGDEEPLKRQLEAFVAAVRTRSRPAVTGRDGRRALALALRVADSISMSSKG